MFKLLEIFHDVFLYSTTRCNVKYKYNCPRYYTLLKKVIDISPRSFIVFFFLSIQKEFKTSNCTIFLLGQNFRIKTEQHHIKKQRRRILNEPLLPRTNWFTLGLYLDYHIFFSLRSDSKYNLNAKFRILFNSNAQIFQNYPFNPNKKDMKIRIIKLYIYIFFVSR